MKKQLKNLMYGAILALPCGAFAQAFTESFGSVGSTSTIAQAAPGFVNPGFTYSGSADVRNTSPSLVTNYALASGAANVFITNTAGKNFQIEGINTSAFSTPVLAFGISKSTTAANGTNFLIEVSSDGITYSALTIPAFPTGSGTAKWYYVTASGSIPTVANLRIRFKNNDITTQYRIDDVKLSDGTGTTTPCTASITAGGATSFCNGSSVLLTANSGTAYAWSTGATTQTISVNQSGSYNVTVTAASGCTAVATLPVMVYPTPTIVPSVTPVNVCAGGSATLCATTLATDLFFSEYVEGPSNEKYIEIYNGTGAAVNLSNYIYKAFHNGASAPTFVDTLSGTLNNGDVIVLKNTAAGAYAGGVATSAVAHNGNDALALYKISTGLNVDIFGVIGKDPISNWNGTGPISTLNQTLRRKPSVYSGVTVNSNLPGQSGFTTLVSEWDAFVSGNVSGLGAHSIDATVYSWSNGGNSSCVVITPTASGVYTVSGTYTVSGCSATATIQVNVVPGLSVIADNDATDITLCYGAQCSNLSAIIVSGGVAPFTYSWSDGTTGEFTTVCPTVTTSYSLTVTDANGCVGSNTTAVNVINACCEGTNVIVCTESGTATCLAPDMVASYISLNGGTVGPCSEGGRMAAPANKVSSARNNAPELKAYPNPFVDNATFEVKIAEASNVKIEVMDYTGKQVVVLNNSALAAGTHEFNWNGNNAAGSNVASGLYLVKITSGNTVQNIKIQKASK